MDVCSTGDQYRWPSLNPYSIHDTTAQYIWCYCILVKGTKQYRYRIFYKNENVRNKFLYFQLHCISNKQPFLIKNPGKVLFCLRFIPIMLYEEWGDYWRWWWLIMTFRDKTPIEFINARKIILKYKSSYFLKLSPLNNTRKIKCLKKKDGVMWFIQTFIYV